MNEENKAKLIQAINAREEGWEDWSWGKCFVGMAGLQHVENVISAFAEWLGVTEDQAADLIYMGGRRSGRAPSFVRFIHLGLPDQKDVLIGALNSIDGIDDPVMFDDRLYYDL